jgi:hypothetical protein
MQHFDKTQESIKNEGIQHILGLNN